MEGNSRIFNFRKKAIVLLSSTFRLVIFDGCKRKHKVLVREGIIEYPQLEEMRKGHQQTSPSAESNLLSFSIQGAEVRRDNTSNVNIGRVYRK